MTSGFPKSKYGFVSDTKDHKREEMEDGKPHQMPLLAGPTGVPWIVDTDFTRSANILMSVHRENAYAECFKRIGDLTFASYGRRLSAAGIDKRHSRPRMAEFCKKTKRTYYSGNEKMSEMVLIHREALEYLGELHRAIVRCIENEVNLFGIVHDLRDTEPTSLNEILDARSIPMTNEVNPYYALSLIPTMHPTLQAKWKRQDDQQIANYHHILGVQ